MTSEMTYTTDPFEWDHYWIIASDDLGEFMAARVDEDPEPRVVFFEEEDRARHISEMDITPESIRGNLVRIERDGCMYLAARLHEKGYQVAIALENGFLLALMAIPMGSGVEGEA